MYYTINEYLNRYLEKEYSVVANHALAKGKIIFTTSDKSEATLWLKANGNNPLAFLYKANNKFSSKAKINYTLLY